MNITDVIQPGALVWAGIFLLIFLVFAVLLRRSYLKKGEKVLQDHKNQFIGLASHYLLTPITIIQTAVTQLQESDTTLSAEQRTHLYDSIALGQQRLWIIAEQLILINQIDFNELQLQPTVTDVADLVSSAVEAVDVFARPKHITIHFEDATQDIKQGHVDVRRMRQAIIAVLDNAIKFSMEEGQIAVRLTSTTEYFILEIRDYGIGMPADTLQHLTEKFFRGSGIYNFNYEGIGLGLHIAYAIVTQHQGTITFESKEKEGTQVVIQFPNLA